MRENDYVTSVRRASRQIVDGYNALRAAQGEWNGRQYGEEDGLTQEELTGVNAEVTPEQVGTVVFAVSDAIKTSIMDTPHGGALYALYSTEV